MKERKKATQLCLTFCDPLFGPWNFPGMDTGVGCHFLLQGIFPTPVSNPGLPQLQADSLSSEPPGKPKGWEHCFCLLTPIHIRHISLQYSALNLHTWDKLNLSMKEVVWKWSCSLVYDSLQLHGLQPTKLLCPWDFPGKSTGVGCHFLLQFSV